MNARDTTTRESKTMTVDVSAELSVEASPPVEAQIEIQLVSEDEQEDKGPVTESERDESNQGGGDVRVADTFFEGSQNGHSRGDGT